MCAFNLQLPRAAAVPDVLLETFGRRERGHAGKMFGCILLVRRQYVDAQMAVALQNRVDARFLIHTQQHGRRFVGNGGHGGHGDAVSPRLAVGGDDVNARCAK